LVFTPNVAIKSVVWIIVFEIFFFVFPPRRSLCEFGSAPGLAEN